MFKWLKKPEPVNIHEYNLSKSMHLIALKEMNGEEFQVELNSDNSIKKFIYLDGSTGEPLIY